MAMKTTAARPVLLCVALALLLAPGVADAQSWQWNVTVRTPSGGSVAAQSRVVLSPKDVSMFYTARIQNRDVPIAACRTAIADIASAQMVRRNGRSFLLVQLKPERAAVCVSGSQSIAITPVGDDSAASGAVAAIDRACCNAAPRAPEPVRRTIAAAVSPSPSPVPAHSPSPAPAAAIRLADWVESEGIFSFVRVQNRGSRAVTIGPGDIEDCRNVVSGCGSFPDRAIVLGRDGVATIATVTASSAAGASFAYRYDAKSGADHATGMGASSNAPAASRPHMSAAEIRSAEAVAVAALRVANAPSAAGSPGPSPSASPPPAFVAVRLTRRGSSRLGIGQTGVALLRVTISPSGMPQQATIVKISNRQLAAAAIETAVSSSYAPALRDGRPVEGTYIATFQFDGDDPALSSIPMWKRGPSPAPVASAAGAKTPSPSALPTGSATSPTYPHVGPTYPRQPYGAPMH
jgi:hypothetical protein